MGIIFVKEFDCVNFHLVLRTRHTIRPLISSAIRLHQWTHTSGFTAVARLIKVEQFSNRLVIDANGKFDADGKFLVTLRSMMWKNVDTDITSLQSSILENALTFCKLLTQCFHMFMKLQFIIKIYPKLLNESSHTCYYLFQISMTNSWCRSSQETIHGIFCDSPPFFYDETNREP